MRSECATFGHTCLPAAQLSAKCKMVQAADMAAEYAAKLALLHDESAARADTDRRKRRERYIMLAELQAQAQVSCQ